MRARVLFAVGRAVVTGAVFLLALSAPEATLEPASGAAFAQTAKPKKAPKPAAPEARDEGGTSGPRRLPAAPVPAAAPERLEADVSTRTIAITSGYSGSEILIFGAIENSRQPSAESGFYDVVVVVEGAPEPLTVREKSRVAGLWINTKTFSFNAVPSYYAVASTRPLEDFADAAVLDENGIGLDAIRMAAAADSAVRVSSEDLIAYKAAVTRLKVRQGLFKRDDYGLVFTGRSLFRSKIDLPATVPVGPLTARIYLFHEGALISRFQARVVLEREGIERWLYAFAFEKPFLYGIVTVLVALLTGLVASVAFHRRAA